MGVKGVKSGNMAKLRGLTEKDLFTMSREEMENLLYSTSKNITASVRKLLKSEYAEASVFMNKRDSNKYPLPREIKLKTAKRMSLEQLKQELRDLSYTANLQTYNVSGTKKYIKKFKKETGKEITDLTSSDWEKIRQKIEQGYDSTSVIKAYDVEAGEIDDNMLDALENKEEQAKQKASNDLSNADMYNLLK